MEDEGRIKTGSTLSSEGCFQGLLCILPRRARPPRFQTSSKFANNTLPGWLSLENEGPGKWVLYKEITRITLQQCVCTRGNKSIVRIWSSQRDQYHACVLEQVEAGAYQMSVKKANNLDGRWTSWKPDCLIMIKPFHRSETQQHCRCQSSTLPLLFIIS